MASKKLIVLLSGGLDSSTLAAYAVAEGGKENVVALSLNYGQRHVKELESAKRIAKWLGIKHIIAEVNLTTITSPFDIAWLKSVLTDPGAEMPAGKGFEQQSKTVVPLRNLLLVTIAAQIGHSVFGGEEFSVAYAAHHDDSYAYPDCRLPFLEAAARAIWTGSDGVVRLVAPFAEMRKADIVKIALNLGVPIEQTWSCYVGAEQPCGYCPSCVARKEALREAGVDGA